jgi:hypothetical protein
LQIKGRSERCQPSGAAWCLEHAGRRVHGSAGHVPLGVFEQLERAQVLPIGEAPEVASW